MEDKNFQTTIVEPLVNEKGEEDVKTPPRKTKAVTNPITGDKNGH